MVTLLGFLWGIVGQPVKTLDAFHVHEKRLRYGFMAYGATGVLLACSELAQGTRPTQLALPLFAAFLAMTFVMLASWFHPFAKALRGKGEYRATLAYLGLPSFVLGVVFVVVDAVSLYLLPQSFPEVARHKVEISRLLLSLGAAWSLVLSVLALERSHAISLPRSVAVAVIAIVVGTPLVLFIYYL